MAAQTAEIIQFRPKPKFLVSDNLSPANTSGFMAALLSISDAYMAIIPKKHKPYMTVRYGEDQWDGYRVNGIYRELTLTGLGPLS